MSVKNILELNCLVQILNGSSNIWSSPWCNLWNNIHDHLNLLVTVSPLPSKIFDLWQPGTPLKKPFAILTIVCKLSCLCKDQGVCSTVHKPPQKSMENQEPLPSHQNIPLEAAKMRIGHWQKGLGTQS